MQERCGKSIRLQALRVPGGGGELDAHSRDCARNRPRKTWGHTPEKTYTRVHHRLPKRPHSVDYGTYSANNSNFAQTASWRGQEMQLTIINDHCTC